MLGSGEMRPVLMKDRMLHQLLPKIESLAISSLCSLVSDPSPAVAQSQHSSQQVAALTSVGVFCRGAVHVFPHSGGGAAEGGEEDGAFVHRGFCVIADELVNLWGAVTSQLRDCSLNGRTIEAEEQVRK